MKLRGIIPPLVTPLAGRDALDEEGLERLVAHVLDGGVQGVFILGSTGEAPSLSYALRRRLIRRVCDLAAGRAPVLVGVTDTAFVESVNLAAAAAEAGASAVVLSTPYYFPAGQAELTEYIQDILPQLPLPAVLYNMPGCTKVWFEIETLRTLADHDKIVGIKDSGGDLEYFASLLTLRQRRPDWSILIGPEHLLVEAVRRGGDGGVCGGANMFPRLFVECYEAAVAGDPKRTEELAARINDLQRLYTIGRYPSRFIKATKCALSLLGICNDFMAEPFHKFRSPERQQVRRILTEQGALP